jgi:phosphoglycolate phosphatase-like HAD superfamily hydrolase
MTNDLSDYATVVFDCDGVLLDSNRIKTEAFRTAALPWGDSAADALVAYHVDNGGVSRYAKFAHFLKEILPSVEANGEGPDLDQMLAVFASAVRAGLQACPTAAGLFELKKLTSGSRWMVVSGGDQAELRDVFATRELVELFDGGIFGSPDKKIEILQREIACRNIKIPAIFLGDSRYDYECAVEVGLDFVFVSGWSEVKDWQTFVAEHKIPTVRQLSDFLVN